MSCQSWPRHTPSLASKVTCYGCAKAYSLERRQILEATLTHTVQVGSGFLNFIAIRLVETREAI